MTVTIASLDGYGATDTRSAATGPATTEHSEMMWVDVESEAGSGRPGESGEDLVGSFDHGLALLAHQVAMGAGRQVIRGRTVPEVGVDDDAEAFQLVEIPVDRRKVD